MSTPPHKKFKLEVSNKNCPYGNKCYRKNPIHFIEFKHPHLEDIFNEIKGDLTQSLEKFNLNDSETIIIQLKLLKEIKGNSSNNTPSSSSSSSPSTSQSTEDKNDSTTAKPKYANINEKIEASAPFRCFLTMIRASKETHKDSLSIAFHQLLDPSLGRFDSSLHITFMIEFDWIMHIYEYHKINKEPMTVLFGVDDPECKSNSLPSNFECVYIKPPTIFGHHHTKMSIISYKDNSIRVIITTANLISSDWENRAQGVWISPKLPPLKPTTNYRYKGDSPTNFRQDLLRYLNSYNKPQLKSWIHKITSCDFSEINVFLVASIPGSHEGMNINTWGHRRLASILKKHCENQDGQFKKSSIVAQCSSIGSLGPDPESWMAGQLLDSFSESNNGNHNKPEMKIIYPSLNNVKSSHDGLAGGACLPYSKKTHLTQKWFEDFLYQWRSEIRHRSKAMPHIKTYTRFNEDFDKVNYFLLTSANLSKAAWGNIRSTKSSPKLQILSYECGVLFLPKFVTSTSYFSIDNCPLIPYDTPLKKYEKNDKVWVHEMMFVK